MLKEVTNQVQKITKKSYLNLSSFIKSRPLTAFIIALVLLFLIIIIGSLFNQPKQEAVVKPQFKNVKVYSIGEAPKASFQGKIDKTGIVKVMALAPGIVQYISVKEGDAVYKGTQILSLSSNYQGGNASALQAQIAQKQYQNILDTYDTQKDLINKQKDVANKVDQNAKDLRDMNAAASTESVSLINDSQSYLDSLRSSLTGSPSADIATQATINQLQGGLNQLKAGQRQLSYQSDGSKPPAELASLQKDMTLKQLDIQQKALDLGKEISKLSAQLAQVSAASMFPASPISGTVQAVYVKAGEQVNPGMPLATIVSFRVHTAIIIKVPSNIAAKISQVEESILTIGGKTYKLRPSFVSSEATDGTLYTVKYIIPCDDDDDLSVADGEYIRVEIPFGNIDTGSAVPFVPIDAVYQTQDTSYLLIVNKNKAEIRQITLGSIYGSFIEVTSGLKSGDQIILNRNIVAGDNVQI